VPVFALWTDGRFLTDHFEASGLDVGSRIDLRRRVDLPPDARCHWQVTGRRAGTVSGALASFDVTRIEQPPR
jgi:hypothetical protein